MKRLKEKPEQPITLEDKQDWVKQFVKEYGIKNKNIKGRSHIFVWKINVSNLHENEIQEYLTNCQQISEEQMKEMGWTAFYIATLDEPTNVTVLNMKTMQYIKI